MKLWRIKTKSAFKGRAHFKYDGSGYLFWDAAVVAASKEQASKGLQQELLENKLELLEFKCEAEEVKYRPNEIKGREEGMLHALRDAAYSFMLTGESKLCWSTWCLTEQEYRDYLKPNKAHVWLMAVKSKMDGRCSIAIDGSNYLYSKLLVPADSKEEAVARVTTHLVQDYCELVEVLTCVNRANWEFVPDKYRFDEGAIKLGDETLYFDRIICVENFGDELLDLSGEQYKRRETDS